MPALYIDRKESELDFESGALTVRVAGERIATLPLGGADRVVVRRAGAVSVRLLAALGERNIGLLVLGGRKGEPLAHLLGAPHGDARVRLGQFGLTRDRLRALAVARHFVAAKIAGQQQLLREALAARPDARKPLFDAEASIAGLRSGLAGAANLDVLRGLEGAAAASYFGGYTALFAPSLGFRQRNRRPPRDPVNACLSLAYTLLFAEAVRAVWIAGLDPFIGFLHAPAPGRESLACDLVEVCRPAADRLVWAMFRDGLLRADHFSDSDAACLMGKAGRVSFYEAYERFAEGQRRRLRASAAALARACRRATPPELP